MRQFRLLKTAFCFKMLLITTGCIFTLLSAVKACDICGGGAGSHYMGLLPEFSKKIAGLRYRYNALQTHISPAGGTTYLTTRERFYITELWGAWNFGDKFKLMGNIPYNHLTKENQGATVSKSGVGDPGLHGFYQLLKNNASFGKKEQRIIKNALWLGIGVKLPLGHYEKEIKSASTESGNTFQLGTGSTDVLARLMYDANINNTGINITGSYKWNTKNPDGYVYGNNLAIGGQVYHKLQIDRTIALAPNAGITYEHAARDMDNNFLIDVSGGNMLLGGLGVEASAGKWAVGVNYQTPLKQKLARGFVQASDRMMFHVAFLF